MLCDSDKNILRSLAHEACEAHCSECGDCITDRRANDWCDECEADFEFAMIEHDPYYRWPEEDCDI